MSKKCEYCDSMIPDEAFACPFCNAKVEKNVKLTPAPKRNETPKNKGPEEKPKKKSGKGKRILAFLLTVLFVAQLAVPAFRYPGFLKKGGIIGKTDGECTYSIPIKYEKSLDWEEKATKSSEVSADGQATACGVSLSTDPVNLSGGDMFTVTDFGSQTDSGEEIHRYDISLGEHRQFDVPVALTFPCVLEEDEDAAVLHYVAETDTWVPLSADYDAEAGTVTAYFSSLSPAEVRKEKRTLHGDLFYISYPANSKGEHSSRKATVEISSYYWSILKAKDSDKLGDEALKFTADPSLYAEDFVRYKDDYIRDKSSAFNEVSSIYSSVSSAIDLYREIGGPILSDVKWNEFGEALGTVSLILSAYQVYDDYQKAGDVWKAVNDPTLLKHLYTNIATNAGTIFSKATGYSSAAFSAAFIVVGLVAVGLDQTVQDAQDAMNKRNADIFNSYFKNLAPFNKNEWYETFREAYYSTSGDPDKAMEIISAKIDSTVSGFWTDIYKEGNLDLLIAATEADTKNYFTKNNIYFYDITDEQKAELNKQMKWAIWKQLKKEVMPLVNRFLVERMQDAVMVELGKFTTPLNKYLEFEIVEQVTNMNDAESVCRYPGCYIYFGVDGKPVPGWDPIIAPEDGADGWEAYYDCTLIGWQEAERPNCLLIYETEDDMKHGEKPLRSVPFTVGGVGSVTHIDVTPTDESLLVWGLEKIVYCPEYSDEAMYYMVNISASETYFGISHACEYGCDYTVTGMAPGKVVHAPNEFVVGFGIDGEVGVDCPLDSFCVTVGEDTFVEKNDSTLFRNADGRTSVDGNDTLYGEAAASRIECKEGNTLVLMINDGEISYFYRAMSEDEAIKNEPKIVETEKPAHIPNPVVFPKLSLSMTERSSPSGEAYDAASNSPYSKSGKTVTFTLESNGDFTLALPSLTASRGNEHQGTVMPEFKVTGNIFDGHFMENAIGASVTKVNCSPRELHYENHYWSVYADEDWEEIHKGTFTHTNPLFDPSLPLTEQDSDVSMAWIELRKGNKLEVRVTLWGAYGNADYDISEVEDHDLRLDFEAILSDDIAAAFTKACEDMQKRQK